MQNVAAQKVDISWVSNLENCKIRGRRTEEMCIVDCSIQWIDTPCWLVCDEVVFGATRRIGFFSNETDMSDISTSSCDSVGELEVDNDEYGLKRTRVWDNAW